jgi:hypothetical protein
MLAPGFAKGMVGGALVAHMAGHDINYPFG